MVVGKGEREGGWCVGRTGAVCRFASSKLMDRMIGGGLEIEVVGTGRGAEGERGGIRLYDVARYAHM